MEKYITPKEAAEILNRSPFTIRMWLRDGKLPGFKTGDKFGKGEWQIRERDLVMLQTKKPKYLKKETGFDILGEGDEK